MRLHLLPLLSLVLPALCGAADAGTAPLANEAQEGVKLAWKADLGAMVGAPALIHDGRVYVGDASGRMNCLKLEDGSVVWQQAGKGSAVSSGAVAVAGKIVYNTDSGLVHALDAGSGEVAWTLQTGGEFRLDEWDYNTSTPATDGETIYLGSGDSHLYALDPADGSVKWKQELSGAIKAPVRLHEGKLYCGTLAGVMHALNATDGSELWHFKTLGEDPYFSTGEILFGAAFGEGIVAFGSRDFRFYGLEQNTGKIRWAVWSPGWTTSMTIADGTAYGFTSDSHLAYAMEAGTGVTKWTAPFPINVFCDPAVTPELLLAGAMNGILYAYDRKSGELRWAYRTQGNMEHDGSLFDEQGGWLPEVTESWTALEPIVASYRGLLKAGAILSGPVVSGERVVFGSADGHVYALDLTQVQ